MLNCLRGNVNSDYRARNRGKQRTPITFAGSDIENPLSSTKLAGKKVSMKVLVKYFALSE